jgi:outer membrane protein assembly factor BamB
LAGAISSFWKPERLGEWHPVGDDFRDGLGRAPRAAVLHAINPATGAEYWNSGNTPGNLAKCNAPTIANGKVLVATPSNMIYVVGLPPSVANNREVARH